MEGPSAVAHKQYGPALKPFHQLTPLTSAKTDHSRHAEDASIILQLLPLEPSRELDYWSCTCRDVSGETYTVHLYNYEVNMWKCPLKLRNGSVLAIRGPFLMPPSRIVVYHPSDVEVFHPAHPKLSDVTWLNRRAWVPTAIQDLHEEYTIDLGDRLHKKGREAAAHFVYSRVLDQSGCVSSWEGKLVLARQMMKQEYYESALQLIGDDLPTGHERLAAEVGRICCEAWQKLRHFEAAAKNLSSALRTHKKHLRREVSEAVQRAAECIGDLPSVPELRDRVDKHQTSVEVGDYVSCSVETVPIKGKGNGMVASRDIRQGDIILMEKALVTGEDHTQPRSNDKVATVAQKITQLAYRNPLNIGAAVKRLCGNGSLTPDMSLCCDARDMESVCSQNMFQLEDVEPELQWIRAVSPTGRGKKQRCALFSKASLFNHSCEPNCFRINVADVIVIRASRHILQGSELTISYVPIDASPAERARAFHKWAFECTCPRCDLDIKRESCEEAIRLRAIQAEMVPLLQKIESKPKTKTSKMAMQLLEYCRRLEAAWCTLKPSHGFEDLVYPFLCAGMSAGTRGDPEDAKFCWQTALRLLGYDPSQDRKRENENMLIVRYIDPLTAFALGHLVRLGEKELMVDYCRLFELLGGCRTELDRDITIT